MRLLQLTNEEIGIRLMTARVVHEIHPVQAAIENNTFEPQIHAWEEGKHIPLSYVIWLLKKTDMTFEEMFS